MPFPAGSVEAWCGCGTVSDVEMGKGNGAMSATRNNGARRVAIIVLSLFTAIVHIWLGLGLWEWESGGWAFVLNGVGYIVLLLLYLANWAPLARLRWIVRWLFIAYTAVTVIAWLFIGTGSPIAGPVVMSGQTLLAYADKAAEVALIVLLWLDGQSQPDDAG